MRFIRALFVPIDIAALVVFRVAFGAIMLWEVFRYAGYGWIRYKYIDPVYHFAYPGFEWVQRLPGDGMYLHFAVLGVLAVCIMVGLFYRAATVLFFVAFTWLFLLDQAYYLNHFYLICLLAFILIFIPAHRAFSLDVVRRGVQASSTVPGWALWLLRGQIAVPYFFGGIAKLNGDWLRGEPMRMWLAERTAFPLIGRWFTEEWMVFAFSYGGLLLDLFIVPLLLWRRTRIPALMIGAVFHLMNNALFSIGIFPWMMIAANTVFLPPDWPRRVWRELNISRSVEQSEFTVSPPLKQGAILKFDASNLSIARRFSAGSGEITLRQLAILSALAIFALYNIALPLRHFFIPGDVNWTEEGHQFSWHMKLRDKRAEAQFTVLDPATAETWSVDPHDYLTWDQVDEMLTRPEMIRRFCQHVASVFRVEQGIEVEVRAWVMVSLNGRPSQLMLDPDANLAAHEYPPDWIMTLVE
jgi:vitamin K-dependent gamma-carboxylase